MIKYFCDKCHKEITCHQACVTEDLFGKMLCDDCCYKHEEENNIVYKVNGIDYNIHVLWNECNDCDPISFPRCSKCIGS